MFMPYLQYQDGMQYRYFELPSDRMVLFGRETHCDFQMIMDPLISREHFGIEKDENGEILLIDLGATNGTFLNERQLDNETIPLTSGDKIRAGSQNFVYYDEIPTRMTQDLLNEVADSMEEGKGFKTVMSEIIGNKNHLK
jgi:pSer/pThr/pTyr-binding forkhead associated (FHA) protein